MKNLTKKFNKFIPANKYSGCFKLPLSSLKLNSHNLNINKFVKMGFSNKENEFDTAFTNSNKLNHEDYMNTFNEDFDKVLSSNEDDQPKRVRLLSIKLLQFYNSREIINLFEEKYIKGLVNNIYGEELSLFVYFYVSLLDKEVKGGNPSEDSQQKNVYVDKRFEKILKMLSLKISDLDLVNLLALSWSVSLLITKLGYNVSDSLRKSIINSLPRKLEVEKKGEIPTICFSIASYTSEDEELNNMITDRITNYSNLFFSDEGLNYISALNLSLICIAWTKVKHSDIDLLNSLADSLDEIKETLNEENSEEVSKIMWTFYMLNFKNEKIGEFLQYFLENNYEKINMNTALDLFVSFSSLNSENTLVMDLLIELITKQTNESDIILDINTFVNIWLGLSKFYLKGGDKSIEGISHMIKFFLSQYEKRKYLSAISMTLDEVCSLLVCFSVLDMEPNKLYSDLGSNVKNNIKKFDNIQLIQLISCGRYLFNSKRHSDLYFLIHDACISSKYSFDNNQLKTIKRILTNDGIISDSIFLLNKI